MNMIFFRPSRKKSPTENETHTTKFIFDNANANKKWAKDFI